MSGPIFARFTHLRLLFWLGFALVLSGTRLPHAQAYPSFIGFGYGSCLTCHYHPLGGGPLSDYGRALGATEVSGRWFMDRLTDDQVGEQSGFLGPFGKLPDWFSLAADYRGMYLDTGLEYKPRSAWINMQLEGSVTLKNMNQSLIA